MYSVSDRFTQAVRARYNYPVIKLQAITGSVTRDIPILDGSSVALDITSEIERTLSATTVLSEDIYDALVNPTTLLRAWRGFRYSDGTDELVPLGTFVVDGDIEDDDEARTITFSAGDVSRKIARNKLIAPITIVKGTNVGTAISQIATTCYSFVQVDLDAVTQVTDAQIVIEASESANPWLDMQALAKAYGLDIYFNGMGVLKWRGSNDAIVWELGGSSCATLTGSKRKAALAETYNGVIVNSTSTDSSDTIQGVAWDDDVNSPTYYLGPFGKVPIYIDSSNVTTVDAAIALAKSKLAEYKGRSESKTWSHFVHPAFELCDRILSNKDGRTYILDKLSIPLTISGGEMTMESREVRV